MNEHDERTGFDQETLFKHLIASRPRRERKANMLAAATSTTLHAGVIAAVVFGTLALAERSGAGEEEHVMLLRIVEEPPPLHTRALAPERPPEPQASAAPELAEVKEPAPETPLSRPEPAEPEPDDEVEGFQTIVEPTEIPDQIPPPGEVELDEEDFSGEGTEGGKGGVDGEAASTVGGSAEVDLTAGPTDTPFTVPPVLLNPQEVERAVRERYPGRLRRLGISGKVLLWVLIDDEGRVLKSTVRRSSGRDSFDEAARSVGQIMRFEAARDPDGPVAVWVVIPIIFQGR